MQTHKSVNHHVLTLTQQELRSTQRHDCCWPASIHFNGIKLTDCVIKDISLGGMRLYIPGSVWTPATFEIRCQQFERPVLVHKSWSRDCYIGVRFSTAVQ